MVVDNSTKESFPQTVSFDSDGVHYELDATGVATRKKFLFKVYSVASYLQRGAIKAGSDPVQTILSDDFAKQLSMKWVRSVSSKQVQESYQESFRKVLSDSEFANLKDALDEFLGFFNQSFNKGDEFILRWLPGGNIEVFVSGKKMGSVTNKNFAVSLWKIWFGDRSVVDRNNLISLIHTNEIK